MKRTISLILCICFLFTLCACRSNKQNANETTTDKNVLNEATPAPVQQQNDYSVGNTVILGQYEQDNNTSNGTEPIEWEVLAVENGKALLLSKHMLERKLYHDSLEKVTWETCSLRKWLNNDFYDAAFSRQEKNQICSVNNKNQDNLKYGTDGGNSTDDNVFLLSTDEVDKYLDWSQVVNRGSYTAYLRAKSETNVLGNYTGWWWLRSAGQNQYFVLYCGTSDFSYFDIRYMGLDVMNPHANVRPAIWVLVDGKSTSENDKDPQNNSSQVVGIYRYYKEIWDTGESTNIEEQREIGVVDGNGDLEIIELKLDGTGYVWFPFVDWIFERECKYNFTWQFNAADNTATLSYSLQEGLDPIKIRGYDTLVFNEEGLSVRVDIDQSTIYYIKD